MRHRVTILAVALLLASCGSSRSQSTGGGAAPAKPAGCGSAHARTLAASGVARVYSSGHAVYGCSTSGSGSYLLGRQGVGCLGAGRVQTIAVAGELTAYGVERCGVDTGSTIVTVRRLSDGKLMSSHPAITKAVAPESFQSVSSLVLRSDGGVAWIAELGSVLSHRHSAEVHRLDRHGFSLLDSGPGGSLTRLRLSGSKLAWKHNGAIRSATIS